MEKLRENKQQRKVREVKMEGKRRKSGRNKWKKEVRKERRWREI